MCTARWFARATSAYSLLVLLMAVPRDVQAEDALRIALFKTASDQPDLKQLAAAVDPLLHSELGNAPGVQVAALPALDLPALQLAVDCVGETPACLSAAAAQAETEALVAPALTKTESAVVLSLLLYDPRRPAPIQAVTRRFSSTEDDQQVLDVVPALVRELFDLGPVEAAPATPQPLPSDPPPIATDPPSLVLPIVLGISGAVLLGAATGLGIAAQNAEDGYAKRRITNDAQGRAALDQFDKASTYATLSSVGFALAGAVLAAGVVVFIVKRSAHDEPPREHARTGTKVEIGPTRLSLTTTWD